MNVRRSLFAVVLAACGADGGRIPEDVGVGVGGRGGGGGAASVPDVMWRPPLGSGGEAGGTADAGSEVCAAQTFAAERKGLDLFILLDQSGSMTENEDRWTPVTRALLAFTESPTLAGVGMGLQYFPRGAKMTRDPITCEPATYATPDVPFGALPAHAAAIRSSIEAHAFGRADADTAAHWGTPTRPAIEGVMPYLRTWAAEHADRRVALLLATDGQPSSFCARNKIADVAAAVTAHDIPTYVIGIGRVENLEQIAGAGKTGVPAFVVDTADTGKTQAAFLAALDAIRAAALPCAFELPRAGAGSIDLQKVNVELEARGERVLVPRTASAASCKPGVGAWHFDDPANPRAIVMCPAACEALRAGVTKVEIVAGCRAVVIE